MDGWLPIHYASAAGHADIVQALLAAGSDVEEPAADGDAPLHKAAIAGHLAAVQLLKTRSQVRSLPVVVFHMPLPPVQKCAMPSAMCCSVFQLSSLPCPALPCCCSLTSATLRGRRPCTTPAARATWR